MHAWLRVNIQNVIPPSFLVRYESYDTNVFCLSVPVQHHQELVFLRDTSKNFLLLSNENLIEFIAIHLSVSQRKIELSDLIQEEEPGTEGQKEEDGDYIIILYKLIVKIVCVFLC